MRRALAALGILATFSATAVLGPAPALADYPTGTCGFILESSGATIYVNIATCAGDPNSTLDITLSGPDGYHRTLYSGAAPVYAQQNSQVDYNNAVTVPYSGTYTVLVDGFDQSSFENYATVQVQVPSGGGLPTATPRSAPVPTATPKPTTAPRATPRPTATPGAVVPAAGASASAPIASLPVAVASASPAPSSLAASAQAAASTDTPPRGASNAGAVRSDAVRPLTLASASAVIWAGWILVALLVAVGLWLVRRRAGR